MKDCFENFLINMFQNLKTEWKFFGIVLLVSVVIITAFIGFLIFIKQESQQVVAPTPTPDITEDENQIPFHKVGEDTIVKGFVTENIKGCMADASCSLFLLINSKEIKVVYEWGGEMVPCINRASEQGLEIKEGDEVEVFGRVIAEQKISTCDSEEYYIKKVSAQEVDTADWQTYRNEEFGFEIQYPSDWTFQAYKGQPKCLRYIICIRFQDTQGDEVFRIALPIPEIGFIGCELLEKKDISTQSLNRSLTKVTWKCDDSYMVFVKWNFVEDYRKSGEIFYRYESPQERKIEIFDKILSTFRFID